MNRKEQWIEEVMNSLQDLQRVQVPPGFEDRMIQGFARRKPIQLKVSRTMSWSLAAGLLFLVGMNVFTVIHVATEQKRLVQQETSRQLANEYFTSVDN